MRLLDAVMPLEMDTVYILCGVIVGLVIINVLLVLYLRRKNRKKVKPPAVKDNAPEENNLN